MSEPDLAARLRAEVGQLTLGPASDFVAARTARVKALKAADEPELARELGRQRRPTVPAWAVDQLAHHHGDELDALFAAADRLRAAQSAATPDRAAVRDASAAFSAQVRHLRAQAGEVLTAAGTAPDAHLDEVEATLLAAATDEEVAADVRTGALLRPVPAPGFAALASLSPPQRPPSRAAAEDDDRDDRDPSQDAGAASSDDEDAARAEAERQARQERREELAARRGRLEDEARDASRTAAAARERVREARAEIERLEREAASAEAELTGAESAEADARGAIADLDAELATLEATSGGRR